MTLHFSQIGFTDDLTFMLIPMPFLYAAGLNPRIQIPNWKITFPV